MKLLIIQRLAKSVKKHDAGDLVEYAYFPDEDGNVIEQFVTLLDTTQLKAFPERNIALHPRSYELYDQ